MRFRRQFISCFHLQCSLKRTKLNAVYLFSSVNNLMLICSLQKFVEVQSCFVSWCFRLTTSVFSSKSVVLKADTDKRFIQNMMDVVVCFCQCFVDVRENQKKNTQHTHLCMGVYNGLQLVHGSIFINNDMIAGEQRIIASKLTLDGSQTSNI